MCVNTDKFQSIILNGDGKHTLSIFVQDNTVLSDTSITVLGVVLDDNLKFDEHVLVLCLKASRQINAFKRVSKDLDEKCRIMVYKSFISSNFNYCNVAWMFCGKKNVIKLEKLQERALRFVFYDATASYEDLLERGNFLPLSVYRIRCLGIEVFKCFHSLNPAYLNDILYNPLWNMISGTHVALNSLNSVLFTYGLRSFWYYGSKSGNLLPYQVKNTREIYNVCYSDISICRHDAARWGELDPRWDGKDFASSTAQWCGESWRETHYRESAEGESPLRQGKRCGGLAGLWYWIWGSGKVLQGTWISSPPGEQVRCWQISHEGVYGDQQHEGVVMWVCGA